VQTSFTHLKDHSLSFHQLKMQFPLSMMHDNVWVDRLHYIEAEEHVHLTKSGAPAQVSDVSSSLVSEISNMRESIKTCVSGITSTTTDGPHVAKLEEENKSLKKLIDDLSKQVSDLTLRVGKLEGTPAPAAAAVKKEEAADDEDDFELFDSEEEEEEETEEEKAKKAELLKKYHEKKSKKPALIPKSNIILDVKPWDDETNMEEMEKMVRTIEMDGLLWGNSKFVPLAYGIKKLQISCVVEDDKVGSDDLSEKITGFEDFVQSVDIAAFNKI
jgi:elongation factor 1-delta